MNFINNNEVHLIYRCEILLTPSAAKLSLRFYEHPFPP